MNIKDCKCVVTGAARGIGFSIAEALLISGAHVVLSDVNREALDMAMRRLSAPAFAQGLVADVASASDVRHLSETAAHDLGSINLWINNAGLARHRPIVDYTEAEIDLMLAVNLKGTILGSQAALRAMAPHRHGQIINIVSTAGLRGVPTETVYCAAKWGARGFTQGLREEAAPHGVRVTALLPGGVDTAFWDDATTGRVVPREKFLSAKMVAEATLALVRLDEAAVPQELVLRAMEDCDFAT